MSFIPQGGWLIITFGRDEHRVLAQLGRTILVLPEREAAPSAIESFYYVQPN
jgi:hypothetical protein